jgi:hypothetical protein
MWSSWKNLVKIYGVTHEILFRVIIPYVPPQMLPPVTGVNNRKLSKFFLLLMLVQSAVTDLLLGVA